MRSHAHRTACGGHGAFLFLAWPWFSTCVIYAKFRTRLLVRLSFICFSPFGSTSATFSPEGSQASSLLSKITGPRPFSLRNSPPHGHSCNGLQSRRPSDSSSACLQPSGLPHSLDVKDLTIPAVCPTPGELLRAAREGGGSQVRRLRAEHHQDLLRLREEAEQNHVRKGQGGGSELRRVLQFLTGLSLFCSWSFSFFCTKVIRAAHHSPSRCCHFSFL